MSKEISKERTGNDGSIPSICVQTRVATRTYAARTGHKPQAQARLHGINPCTLHNTTRKEGEKRALTQASTPMKRNTILLASPLNPPSPRPHSSSCANRSAYAHPYRSSTHYTPASQTHKCPSAPRRARRRCGRQWSRTRYWAR